MRVRCLWTALVVLSAVACSGSSTSPTVFTPDGDISWTEGGQSFQVTFAARETALFAGADEAGDLFSSLILRGVVCNGGTGIEIRFQRNDSESFGISGISILPGIHTVAALDISVGYTDGTTVGGDPHEDTPVTMLTGWGAGSFGGSGSVTLSETGPDGDGPFSGTFSFELVPTAGNPNGSTKSVQGTITRVPFSIPFSVCLSG